MVKHTTKKLPKNTLEILLDIPWKTISEEYEKAFVELMKDLTVEGFRKGKAPRAIAEKHMQRDRVYDAMIRAYLPKQYDEILQKEDLKPIASPKIELVKAKENEDWQVKFLVPMRPEIKLKDYKKIVTEAKSASKKSEIWTPGQDKEAPKMSPEQEKEMQLQAALNALVDKVEVEISDVIIDEEVNNRLIKLVDDLQKLGITVESYVKSRNTTVDELKAQFRKEIEETFKLEFLLQEIGDQEKISVEKEDLDKMMSGLKDDKEREAFMRNAYYYASLLRKQKILEHLISL